MTPPARHTRARPRALVPVLLTALLAVLAAPAAQAASAPPEPTVRDLGPAVMSVNVRSATFATLADGTPVVYAISNGNPATFTMVDVTTGEALFSAELDDTTLGGWITAADDGMVYFTARHPMNAGLFSFDPRTHELSHIAAGVAGERVLYDGSVGPDGRLYFGTYPNAKVVAYDPTTGEFEDYGTQATDAAYVFSLGIVDGEIWAGTGPVPHLYAIDPGTRERREIHPPAHVMANTQWFIGIDQRADSVLVRLSPRGTYDTAVLDLSTGEWSTDVIPGVFGSAPTAVDSQGRAYVLSEGTLVGYETTTGRLVPTGFADTELADVLAEQVGTYGMEVMEVPGAGGESVVGLSTDGDLWTYHLDSGEASVLRADIAPSPAEAHGLGVGPDGNTYIGAYLSSGSMTRVDAETLELEPLRGPKQADAIATHGDELVVTSYPGAVVHAGDLDQEWRWGTNPRHVLTLERGEPYFQDRINGVVSTGELLALGTVPDYGQLGGALTFLDTGTGEFAVHRDVVEDQSVISLAYADGLVYGGTAISGGLSSTPTAQEARLFVWDVATASLVWEGAVSDEAGYVAGLSWGADGQLVGGTSDGLFFEFDPTTREIMWTARLFPAEQGNHRGWGYATKTIWDERTGTYLVTSNTTLYQVDRETGDVRTVAEEMEQITRDRAGNVIGVDQTNAYVIELHAPVPECTHTVHGDHAGALQVTAGVTCIEDATVRGPVTVEAGAALVVTGSSVRGPLDARGAAGVNVTGSEIRGPLRVAESTGNVELADNDIRGPVALVGNTGGLAPLVAGNTVRGPLSCTGNDPAPVDGEAPNEVSGTLNGQCVGL